ncbi:hypothetical protein BGW80DRAFT_1252420 [Lactifluus volemus]|nr:hypothetical protein BGW80DRAFT_1252420 [Lactifluus volemus]
MPPSEKRSCSYRPSEGHASTATSESTDTSNVSYAPAVTWTNHAIYFPKRHGIALVDSESSNFNRIRMHANLHLAPPLLTGNIVKRINAQDHGHQLPNREEISHLNSTERLFHRDRSEAQSAGKRWMRSIQARYHNVMHWHVTGGHVVLAGDSAAMRVDMPVIDAQGWGDQGEIRLAESVLILETQPTPGDDSTSRVTDVLDGVCVVHFPVTPQPSLATFKSNFKSATLIMLRYSRTALRIWATLLVWSRFKSHYQCTCLAARGLVEF